MLYEFKSLWKKLRDIKDPKCVICDEKVDMFDYYLMCKKCGKIYYNIWKFWRMILPKFVIKNEILR